MLLLHVDDVEHIVIVKEQQGMLYMVELMAWLL